MESGIKLHIENHIQVLIDDLRARVLFMAAKCQSALDYTYKSLEAIDPDLAQKVIDLEEEIDNLEVEIDAASLNILARTQPVASDLRLLISAIRIVVDLERIGDESVNIANHIISMREHQVTSIPPILLELSQAANDIVDKAVESFRDKNSTQVIELRKQTDEITKCSVKVIDYCSKALQKNTIDGWLAMHYMLIGHSLARIASRGINIAEHTSFVVDGVSLKHRPVEL